MHHHLNLIADRILATTGPCPRYFRLVEKLAHELLRLDERPALVAYQTIPGWLEVVATYADGRTTCYPRVPVNLHLRAWSVARARGMARGAALAHLRAVSPPLESLCLCEPAPSGERSADELRACPGDLAGWSESLRAGAGHSTR